MSVPGADIDATLRHWHPAEHRDADPLAAARAARLCAVLDVPGDPPRDGDPLPPLWHWLYFLHWLPHRALGADGHAAQGRYLPPIPERRRMFAGGRCTWHAPLRFGCPASRTSRLAGVTVKPGRSGQLVFVTERHEIHQAGELCLTEETDLVYRSGGRPSSGPPAGDGPATSDAPWQRAFTADPVLLFRFSALTANAHRIHYDLPYARDVEGFPGLVVHGPLLVLLMTELVRERAPARRVTTVDFRLRQPLFAGTPAVVTGTPDAASAYTAVLAGGGECARAEVRFDE